MTGRRPTAWSQASVGGIMPLVPLPLGSLRGLPAPDWLLQRPIAHRGLHDDQRPENSLAAFEAAAAAGHPIELDVHRTRDGRALVFHDADLHRMTGHHGRVADATMGELSKLRLLGTDEPIPTLDEVLERVADRVPVVVEIKARLPIGSHEREVRDVLRRHPGRYTVQSFDPRSLVWMRRHAPELPRGMLVGDIRELRRPWYEKLLVRTMAFTPLVRPSYVGYDIGILPHWAATGLRGAGIAVIAWTIANDEQLARARRLADNVIFEHVDPRARA